MVRNRPGPVGGAIFQDPKSWDSLFNAMGSLWRILSVSVILCDLYFSKII